MTTELELTAEERALPRDAVGWYAKYGVSFVDLTPPDLELLRGWRNHPDIQQFMVFRETITPEMQARWFGAIDPAREAYAIVYYRGERVGLTQLRHIDAAAGSAEGGIIIFKPEHQNGLLPYRAALAGMDWNFLGRGLRTLWVTVLKTNSRARRMVRSLGYVLTDPDPAGATLRGEVTAAAYFRAAAPWRAVIHAETEAELAAIPRLDLTALTPDARLLPRDALDRYAKYGITFAELYPEDLAPLRAFAAQPEIAALGIFADDPLRWYRAIAPDHETYATVFDGERRVGLTRMWLAPGERTAETQLLPLGSAVDDDDLFYRAAVAGMDWDFLARGLLALRTRVAATDVRSLRRVRALGYTVAPAAPGDGMLRAEVHAPAYFAAAEALRAAFRIRP